MDDLTPMQLDSAFPRLQTDVIRAGLCTHCGTCAGLSGGTLKMQQTASGPLPTAPVGSTVTLPTAAYEACPGKGLNYPDLNTFVFGRQPDNWLIGNYREIAIGYAAAPAVRRRGASGGVISQSLIALLEQGLVDGAIVSQQGVPRPWLASPVIARTAEEILAASQSIYQPVPVNEILSEAIHFEGRLAYVGLPDQVASIRRLQALHHPAAERISIILGPYTGTNMYLSSIRGFLRANGVKSLEEIAELRYREGEWPGYLQIKLGDGRTLRAEKFYYNYLIPFHITRSTLLSVDFTNELTDISVGDAWSPAYEAQGKGFSVVVARTEQGADLLARMKQAGQLVLEPVDVREALAMHGHMLDFKKRGSFIRIKWRQALGKAVPDFGYRPAQLSFSRQLVELVISGLFLICGTPLMRALVTLVPLGIIGPVFDVLRKAWKGMSRGVKRKDLSHYEVRVERPAL